MEIRPLTDIPLPLIIDCFNAAFADYIVPMRVAIEPMRRRWLSCRTDYRLSFGAFDGDQLGGIMITGVDEWHGKKTAYNGGTGVIPAYRGRRIVQQMYAAALPFFRQEGIKQCSLEVIVGNDRAIRAYESVGFQKVRRLHCFSNSDDIATPIDGHSFQFRQLAQPDWAAYRKLQEFGWSWENQTAAIELLAEEFSFLELYSQEELLAYLAFRPEVGLVAQFGVKHQPGWQSVGQALWQQALHLQPSLRINNIAADATRSLAVLQLAGMRNTIDQWEMRMEI